MKMHKDMTNLQLVDLLSAVAASYQINDDKNNKFKIIAYERAADAVEHLSSEAKDLWSDGTLAEVPGIGESIASHLSDIFSTGSSKHFSELMEDIPPSVFELIKLPGIGPKNGYKLAKELKIGDNPIGMLMKHALSGNIAKLEGFGDDSQNAIIKAIEEYKGKGPKRMLLPYALNNAQLIIDWMKKSPFIQKVDVLGSMRRRTATVGDIDIAAAAINVPEALTHFTKYPDAKRVFEKGERTAGIIIPPELHVDLMVQKPESYGALLQHFTGSKHHNIKLRENALKNHLSLSEYGIKPLTKIIHKLQTKPDSGVKNNNYNEKLKMFQFEDEESFYEFLGMDWIPPEIREDKGEIDAALAKKLPHLVELNDIKADLQVHSSFDIETSHDLGASSMEEVIDKADLLGYEYIAFTEHNPSQKGHTESDVTSILEKKREEVDKLNSKLKKTHFKKAYNSLEIDILPKGSLPVPEKGLDTLDFALISVHSSFRLSRDEMTKRVIDALSHPKVKIFAHPTARKINERAGIELDWDKLFEFCLSNDKWLEINADPMRLDLPDNLVFEAVKKGVKLTMGTDAHHIQHMDNMKYGISVARRGWVEKINLVNTLDQDKFSQALKI